MHGNYKMNGTHAQILLHIHRYAILVILKRNACELRPWDGFGDGTLVLGAALRVFDPRA